jgi:hypothetical protein
VVTVRAVMELGTPPLEMAPEMGLAVIQGLTHQVERTRRTAAFSIRFPAANPLIPGPGRRAELIRGRALAHAIKGTSGIPAASGAGSDPADGVVNQEDEAD